MLLSKLMSRRRENGQKIWASLMGAAYLGRISSDTAALMGYWRCEVVRILQNYQRREQWQQGHGSICSNDEQKACASVALNEFMLCCSLLLIRMHCCRAVRETMLTPIHCKKCKKNQVWEHQNWTTEQWRKKAWLDESCFLLDDVDWASACAWPNWGKHGTRVHYGKKAKNVCCVTVGSVTVCVDLWHDFNERHLHGSFSRVLQLCTKQNGPAMVWGAQQHIWSVYLAFKIPQITICGMR